MTPPRLSWIPHLLLSLFHLLGQEAFELIDEKRSSGDQEVLLDVSGLESGLYLLKLETDKVFCTRIVVK